MEFLTPTFLTLAAGAAAVPILIHLIRRNKATRVHFAAMQFLLGSSKRVTRWLRLKQLLILLMRILAVALLGLAFARPFIPGAKKLAILDSHGAEIAIVLDVTASMTAGEHWQNAQHQVEKILAGVKPGMPVTVCLAGQSPKILFEREPDAAAVAAGVRALAKPTHAAGNLREALVAVDEILHGSAEQRREIYLVSDFQETSWPKTNRLLTLASNARLVPIAVAEEPWANAAISQIGLPGPGSDVWKCVVENSSPQAIKDFEIRLILNDKIAARQRLQAQGDRAIEVDLGYRPADRSNLQGYFELLAPGDAYAGDNRYYFSMTGRQLTRVLALDGEPGQGAADELFFVAHAFNLKASPFDLLAKTPARIGTNDFNAFDIVLLANVQGLNHDILQALHAFVDQGGGLIFAPGDAVAAPVFNRLFFDVSPAALQAPARPRIDRASGSILLLGRSRHAFTEEMAALAGPGWQDIYFYQYWRLKPAKDAEVLATFNGGDPAVVERRIGRGKVLLLAFPLDTEWSELPVKTAFVPLLYSIGRYLRPEQDAFLEFTVGQPVFLGRLFGESGPISALLPDGQQVELSAGEQLFTQTEQPGIYRLRQGRSQQVFGFNIDRSESVDALIPTARFESWISTAGEQNTFTGRSERESDLVAREAESSQKLWRFALLFVVVLLLGESFLANRTPR